MKKFYFLSLILVSTLGFSQVSLPYYESFNYTDASNLGGQGNWVNVNSGDEVLVQAGNLSYSGLQASTGNSVAFDGLGVDPQLTITSQTSNEVFASFIIKVTDVTAATNANGGYFFGFGSNATTFSSTVWLKQNGTQFNIGLDKNTSTTNFVFDTTDYSINSEIFIVISYDFTTNTSKMWINPVSTSLGIATAPTATLTASTGTDRTSIDRIFIRQDSVSETPFIVLDETRVGNSWADVTPVATASTKNFDAIAGLKMYPNPVTGNVLNISSTANLDMNVAIFDVLGKQVINTKVTNNTVNVSSLNAGVYIVKVTEDGKTATRKLVVN